MSGRRQQYSTMDMVFMLIEAHRLSIAITCCDRKIDIPFHFIKRNNKLTSTVILLYYTNSIHEANWQKLMHSTEL
jgi:hypothetical protein